MPIVTAPRTQLGPWGVSRVPGGPYTGKTEAAPSAQIVLVREGVATLLYARRGVAEIPAMREGVGTLIHVRKGVMP